MMKILIDADGCPVVRQTVLIAEQFGIPCFVLCDTSHQFFYENVIVCDRGADSVDLRLVNLLEPGDLCVTQDYGLAAMCLSRGGSAVSQDGLFYSEDNIGALLEERALSGKLRRAGGRMKGPKKRTAAQDAAFEHALRHFLTQGSGSDGTEKI